jgi:murein endopeptidase
VAAKAPTGPNFDLGEWFHEARLATRSTSVGQANRGRLVRSSKMDLQGRSWRFLPAIRQRGTQYGNSALIRLLEGAGDAVAAEFPGAILEIGNVGRIDGGSITQSKSHQGGRDVDLVFFALDSRGRSRPIGRMVKYKADLTAGNLTFDVARNWALVKALVTSEDPVVQWIFLYAPMRTALLAHARQLKEPGKIVRLASAVLHQPGDSAPHSDHMHVRIFCSDWDRAAGCRDYGPDRNTLTRDDSLLDNRLRQLNRRARRGLTSERLESVRALVQLPGAELVKLADDLLCDTDAKLVQRAVDLLPRLRAGEVDKTLAGKLACAANLDALYVLFKPVATYQHKRVWQAARKILNGNPCATPTQAAAGENKNLAELCGLAAQSLGYSRTLADGLLLAPLLESKNRKIRKRALRGLQTLYVTKKPVVPPDGELDQTNSLATRWAEFVKQQHKLKWAKQASAQLLRQGFAVDKRLMRKDNAPELLRAVKAKRHISFTAQIVLARFYDLEWLRPLKAKAAYTRFSPLVPAGKKSDPGQQAKTTQTTKAPKLPDLPTLD